MARKCDGASCFALPYDDHAPTQGFELLLLNGVPRDVGFKLLTPEVGTGCGCGGESATGMAMPKASMDEDDRAPTGQDNVGATGEGAIRRTADREAKSQPVENASDDELGLRVAKPHALHQRTPLGGREWVASDFRSSRTSLRRGARAA